MADQYTNLRNTRFLLYEVFQLTDLNRFERYQDFDRESFDFIIDAAKQLADQYLFPYYREMDREKAEFKDGKVKVHPSLKEAIRALAEGGWISAYFDYDAGGQQMPLSLLNPALNIFYSANANAASYAFLTQGAANLIQTFGSEALKAEYIPPMFSGAWQGTMALTEPQAGSSLSDLTTSATPQADGTYKLKGQKIYISGGDHDAVDNVIHMMLARIDGAPPGTKGISLFVVPKYRKEGDEFVPNDVLTAGIYGKMGQKGYVAAHLMVGENDDCIGYLVGEAHHGLSYMFQLMNEARIATGNLATGAANAAFHASLQYARERAQGRHPGNKDATEPPVLIIEHADVRRMLLKQKAITEGSLSLIVQCSLYADLAQVAEGEERENAHLLLELLTPIAKSYPAEKGIESVSTGMQVLGGAGYTDDFPLEQLYRDIRVNAIYEGTTTIHGMDLLGRKIMMAKGRAASLFFQEVKQVIEEASKFSTLENLASDLAEAAQSLHAITLHLSKLAMEASPRVFLADASIYLEYFGTVCIGWQWLKQAIAAAKNMEKSEVKADKDFYQGKLFAARYFFAYELPKTLGLHKRLSSDDRLTLEVENAYFD